MKFLDAWLGGFRLWRRVRGGRWLDVFPVFVPGIVGGWVRSDEPLRGEIVMAAEDYTLPRAKALPWRAAKASALPAPVVEIAPVPVRRSRK